MIERFSNIGNDIIPIIAFLMSFFVGHIFLYPINKTGLKKSTSTISSILRRWLLGSLIIVLIVYFFQNKL